MQRTLGLLVVDEVHCISDWGHDFRPDYRRIASILRSSAAVGAGTRYHRHGQRRVQEDVEAQFGSTAVTIRGSLARRSLRLATLVLHDQAERLAWLSRYVPEMPGSGHRLLPDGGRHGACGRLAAVRKASMLTPTTRACCPMKGGTRGRAARNEIKALVATVALGMGYDKPDLGFVVHYQRPGSVIAYYQQVGRAGRAVESADGILLSGREDDDIAAYFISSAFPPAVQMEAVVEVLTRVDTATVAMLERELNVPRRRLETILKLLDVDGAVDRDGSRYFRTLTPWTYDQERVDRVSALREAEVAEMRDYLEHPGCLMQFLTSALDDPFGEPCGRCMNCRSAPPPSSIDHDAVLAAIEFLQRDQRVIEPRKLWPTGAVAGLTGRISPPNEPGLALSIYGDAGWGRRVAEAKYGSGSIGAELIAAAADTIRDAWSPSATEGWWVTAVPSWRYPGFVSAVAAGIAERLGLPYRVDILSMALDTPPQREMQNSARQLGNVHAGLGASGTSNTGPVIIIDDVVDSRWTLTVAGYLLRSHGSGLVHPFALAEASGGNS